MDRAFFLPRKPQTPWSDSGNLIYVFIFIYWTKATTKDAKNKIKYRTVKCKKKFTFQYI